MKCAAARHPALHGRHTCQTTLIKALTFAGLVTLNTSDVAELKLAMTELTTTAQQTQSKTDALQRTDQRTAAQLSQMQQVMQNVEANLQQVCTV